MIGRKGIHVRDSQLSERLAHSPEDGNAIGHTSESHPYLFNTNNGQIWIHN
jgi:hypothetical protein